MQFLCIFSMIIAEHLAFLKIFKCILSQLPKFCNWEDYRHNFSINNEMFCQIVAPLETQIMTEITTSYQITDILMIWYQCIILAPGWYYHIRMKHNDTTSISSSPPSTINNSSKVNNFSSPLAGLYPSHPPPHHNTSNFNQSETSTSPLDQSQSRKPTTRSLTHSLTTGVHFLQ